MSTAAGRSPEERATAGRALAELLPAALVDPHIHQWDPLTTRREASGRARLLRPLPALPRALRRVVPLADREFVGDPRHVLRPYLPGTYAADCGGLPVASVVHVEASWPVRDHLDGVEETRWLTTLPFGRDGAPRLGGIVARVDPRWEDAGAVLDAHLRASELVRGVRLSASHHPDPGVRDFTDAPAAYAEPAFLDGFEAVAGRGLSFELWCYAHQLPAALGLVRRYPETTFVLDHYATPVGLLGPRGRHTGRYPHQRREQLAAWREDLAALAEHPNAVAKHSGLGMPSLGEERRAALGLPEVNGPGARAAFVDAVAPLIRHLHACFGPGRTMWASNYPIDKPGLTLPATVGLLLEVLGAEADLPALTHDVAHRVYRLPAPAPDLTREPG
ncbi:amidohydrolase family protein [Streptomyces sp. DSM 44917]|uniref:Amidohydrolase family protein n=1 Tax=Streptomyces boetiae TaxID=3075541 RepID=A0ABU2LEX5_9ACTN|nr:amidohydrolase family protein [Streptomyces sp. DSM 44917]MDT0310126.1 amidohydrolase family protein [Streptomyces sp. DSM 44917]